MPPGPGPRPDVGLALRLHARADEVFARDKELSQAYKDRQSRLRLMNDFYNKYKPKELADVKVLYLHGHGPGLLHAKTPVRTLEDLFAGQDVILDGCDGSTPFVMRLTDLGAVRVFDQRTLEEVGGLAEAFLGALVQVIAPLQAEVARGEVVTLFVRLDDHRVERMGDFGE